MKKIPIRQIRKEASESNPTESFSIRDVTELLSGKDLKQDVHRHDFYFILALKKGHGTHEIDFVPYKIKDYCFFFLRPGQVHQIDLKAGSTGFVAQFNAPFYYPNDPKASQLLRQVSKKTYCQLDESRADKLFLVLKNILDEFREKQEGYQDVVRSNLGILFIELFRHRKQNKGLSDQSGSYQLEGVEHLMELIEKNFVSIKKVTQYAEMLNMSSFQLNSMTKTALGKTCSELIDEHIILEAKRNLLATTNQVKEIAFNLGYDDNSYFIRFFKKRVGCSPEEFRKNPK